MKAKKSTLDYLEKLNTMQYEFSMAALEAGLEINVTDEASECAREIAMMIVTKLNEMSELRKEIAKKRGFA